MSTCPHVHTHTYHCFHIVSICPTKGHGWDMVGTWLGHGDLRRVDRGWLRPPCPHVHMSTHSMFTYTYYVVSSWITSIELHIPLERTQSLRRRNYRTPMQIYARGAPVARSGDAGVASEGHPLCAGTRGLRHSTRQVTYSQFCPFLREKGEIGGWSKRMI